MTLSTTDLSVPYQLPLEMDFTNKVVVITGANSGIGAACALLFAKFSATLSLVGRNKEKLEIIVGRCELLSGVKPLSIVADITTDEGIDTIIQNTIKDCGSINILVNNAGISVLSDDVTAYDSIMATNVRAHYILTKKAMPYLLETKGNIIHISSMLSCKPIPSATAYCMSKAALDMFTKCAALQYGARGVRVNSVNPGPVKTDIFRRAGISDFENEKLFASLETASPLRKVTGADDVAELVAFLASEKATCITGSTYILDCGLSLGGAEEY